MIWLCLQIGSLKFCTEPAAVKSGLVLLIKNIELILMWSEPFPAQVIIPIYHFIWLGRLGSCSGYVSAQIVANIIIATTFNVKLLLIMQVVVAWKKNHHSITLLVGHQMLITVLPEIRALLEQGLHLQNLVLNRWNLPLEKTSRVGRA